MDVLDSGEKKKLTVPTDGRKRIGKLVWLVKKGDATSLKHLRVELGKSCGELSRAHNISQRTLGR
jgi:hypothetical protein